MDSMSAFAMGLANRGKETMVFDWIKAAELIRDEKPNLAGAGLSGDWEYTGGDIWEDGKPVPKEDTYTYLESTWATPELEMDGRRVDCYKMSSELPGWDSSTYWPKEALAILGINE
jgi:hypothetical protein